LRRISILRLRLTPSPVLGEGWGEVEISPRVNTIYAVSPLQGLTFNGLLAWDLSREIKVLPNNNIPVKPVPGNSI